MAKDRKPARAAMTAAERRELLARMDLVTTQDLVEALRISKATLARMEAAGLRRVGYGKQRFVRLSSVAPFLESPAGSPPAD